MKKPNLMPWRKQKEIKLFICYWIKNGFILLMFLTALLISNHYFQHLKKSKREYISILQKHIQSKNSRLNNAAYLKKQTLEISKKLSLLNQIKKNRKTISRILRVVKNNDKRIHFEKIILSKDELLIQSKTIEKNRIEIFHHTIQNLLAHQNIKLSFDAFRKNAIHFSIRANRNSRS